MRKNRIKENETKTYAVFALPQTSTNTPFHSPPSQHFRAFNDHGSEGNGEDRATPDFAGPGLGPAPVVTPYSHQSAHRMNTGRPHLSHPPPFGFRDDSPHAGSSESSALTSWRGEDVRCAGQSLSPYVCTAP